MKNVFSLISLLLLFIHPILAQNEASVWQYRYGEGLDFNTNPPALLSGGSIQNAEGTAAISDTEGNLLFYTDGVTVWNSIHEIMPNGEGLMGNTSTTQSALIIPQPNNNGIYYVFTAAQTCVSDGLRYSIVDMSLNEGLGDLIQENKNTPLLTPVFEKMAAVHHCNGEDIWLMAMKSNGDFYVWLVTENGLCNCPVISTTGPVHEQGFGAMKFSNNGEKLVVAESYGACGGSTVHTDLYDFNLSTGDVSFNQSLGSAVINNSSSGGSYWGASFSPNNQVLYLSTGFVLYNGSGGMSQSTAVAQYDLSSPVIEDSGVLLFDNAYDSDNPGNGCGAPMGSLQLALDGKIYVGNGCSMDVISNPNILGTGCTYIHDAIPDADGSGYGITNFIESYFGDGVSLCSNSTTDACTAITEVNCPTTSIHEDVSINHDIVFYPNPTTGHISVITDLVVTKMTVTNVLGEIVLTSPTDSINLNQLPSSVYLIHVTTNQGIHVQRIVKE